MSDQDKPQFLKGTGDDPKEEDAMDVLRDEPLKTDAPTDPAKPNEEKPVDTTVPPDDTTTPPDLTVEKVTTIEPDKLDDNQKKYLEEHKTELSEEQRTKYGLKVDTTVTPKMYAGKFKSVEEFERSYDELERALGRANNTVQSYKEGRIPPTTDGKPSEIKQLMTTSMIFPKLPNYKNYILDKETGEVDIARYMGDSFKSFALAIQQSLLGGPLASAQFGILSQALKEERDNHSTDIQNEKRAEDIETKLYTDFPRLKTDEKVSAVVQKAIFGEKYRRAQEAQANKTQPKELEYKDYYDLLVSILGVSTTKPADQIIDPTEENKGSPTLLGGIKAPVNEMDTIIDGMEKVGRRGQLF